MASCPCRRAATILLPRLIRNRSAMAIGAISIELTER